MYYISGANFEVFPKVVKANSKTKIRIVGSGTEARFKKGITYKITVTPMEITENGEHEQKEYYLTEENGNLSFEHYFHHEQQWNIHLSPEPNPEKMNLSYQVYSVEDDLYERIPFVGDTHTHSIRSDGSEEPVILVGEFRRRGYDFFCMTDHNSMAPGFEVTEKAKDIPTDMKVFRGEEVHIQGGCIHMIDLFATQGINELYWSDPERYHKEIVEESKKLDIPDNVNRLDYAYRKWISDRIHENGGICILAHSKWIVSETGKNGGKAEYHMPIPMIDFCLKTGVYDAVEYATSYGTSPGIDNMRADYERIFVKDGKYFPITGCSDTHCPNPIQYYLPNHSMFFVKERTPEGIKEAMLNGYNVTVEINKVGYQSSFHGQSRFVKFACFLNANYLPYHDAMCAEEGEQIINYIDKVDGSEQYLKLLQGRTIDYYKECYGKV